MVLDTSGTKLGFSDSEDGGFVLFRRMRPTSCSRWRTSRRRATFSSNPNEVDIYYSDSQTGSIGLIDTNTQRTFDMQVTEDVGQDLSSPSRSLDGRYVYVANNDTGEVYSINAFSKVVYRTFEIGASPARPYTTPEGVFLYMMDKETGRFVSIDQHRFEQYEDIVVGEGIDSRYRRSIRSHEPAGEFRRTRASSFTTTCVRASSSPGSFGTRRSTRRAL